MFKPCAILPIKNTVSKWQEESIPFRYYKFYQYKNVEDMYSVHRLRSWQDMVECSEFIKNINKEIEEFNLIELYPEEIQLWINNDYVCC